MKPLIRVLGTALLAGVLAWRLDWSQLRDAFVALDVRHWVAALVALLIAQLISSLRWQLLAEPLDFTDSYWRYVRLYFVGMFFNLVLPTSVGGDVVRAWYLGGERGRRGPAFLTVLADRGIGVAVLVVMACVAAVFVPIQMPGWMVTVVGGLAAGCVVGAVLIPFLPALTRIVWIGPKLVPLVELVQLYLGQPGLLLSVTILSLLVQLSSVSQVWLVSVGLGLDVSFGYLAVVVPLVSLLTLVPISLNGMGLREVGLVVLLAPVDVTAAQAVSLSLLHFAINLVGSLMGGVCYLNCGPTRVEDAAREQDDDHPVRRGSDQGRERQPAQAA